MEFTIEDNEVYFNTYEDTQFTNEELELYPIYYLLRTDGKKEPRYFYFTISLTAPILKNFDKPDKKKKIILDEKYVINGYCTDRNLERFIIHVIQDIIEHKYEYIENYEERVIQYIEKQKGRHPLDLDFVESVIYLYNKKDILEILDSHFIKY